MSNFNEDGLRPRPGPAPRLIEGPKVGQRSLYHQQVLDEDSYTDALSKIIERDFFSNLPHLHATNDYLSALTTNDPELLSSSIRALARISQDKEDRRRGIDPEARARERDAADSVRRAELDLLGTPYISLPGRTPLGARGWDTPLVRGSTSRRAAEAEDIIGGSSKRGGDDAGPSRPAKRLRVRDDLSLDAFQRNYTSEDNASFVRIVDTENRKRQEERYGWAWEAERRANERRIQGEERRKMILDAATSGAWRVDGDGRRLVGGLGEGGQDRTEGEAWKERRLITAGEGANFAPGGPGAGSEPAKAITAPQPPDTASALVPHATSSATSSALITRVDGAASVSAVPPPTIEEHELPPEHPLSRALIRAGLPPTALVSTADGSIVPHREATQGAGDGRGRGDEARALRERIEREVLGDDYTGREHLALGGSGTEQWPYKMMNNLMFPPDAYTKPYPSSVKSAVNLEHARQGPPRISHANTRMPGDDDDGDEAASSRSSRRGSSPARSWVDAAVRGTPYRPGGGASAPGTYGLVDADPSLVPEELPSLLTWGTLLATPRALDDSSDPLDGPTFRLPETKRRDELGRKLGNRASHAISERAKGYTPRPVPATPSLTDALRAAAERTRRPERGGAGGAGMAPPSSTPRREEGLTPAARSLLDRSLGRTPGRAGLGGLGGLSAGGKARAAALEKGAGWGGTAGAGGKSWTPSPYARR